MTDSWQPLLERYLEYTAVHHILPLDDLGTNAFSNLIPIRAFEHSAITAYQNAFSRDLAPGDVILVDFPIPPPGQMLWPPVTDPLAPELELWRRTR